MLLVISAQFSSHCLLSVSLILWNLKEKQIQFCHGPESGPAI
jgi:hypothetical protein